MDEFLPQKGNYKKLKCFQLAEAIYEITFYFCEHFLRRGDRTCDQMLQAARSGKQNIAEGSAAGTTSKETEIKLTNVAKASLQELLLDYEDYLGSRELVQWQKGDARLEKTRAVLRENHPREFYREKAKSWSAGTLANVALTMIHQCDFLLARLIESQKKRFLQEGGSREAMTRARLQYRKQQSSQNPQKSQISPSAPSAPSSRTITMRCPHCGKMITISVPAENNK